MIPQEFNLISSLNVFENVFLGQEDEATSLLKKKVMRDKTQALFSQLETKKSTLIPLIEELSIAEKQMVEIAKALVNDAQILIMARTNNCLNQSRSEDFIYSLLPSLSNVALPSFLLLISSEEVKQLSEIAANFT